jgi:hypothetical protein
LLSAGGVPQAAVCRLWIVRTGSADMWGSPPRAGVATAGREPSTPAHGGPCRPGRRRRVEPALSSTRFHDTANAVATVIYTRALGPWMAVSWSGLWNFIGVPRRRRRLQHRPPPAGGAAGEHRHRSRPEVTGRATPS